ncbi:hypothetical protein [Brachybacterium sp. UNK5269]|uniref:hypothetical protein n=1 Tax=Brachybacterium sp. UNK5269 TaxID=3408576 RepID=UPI003BAE356B
MATPSEHLEAEIWLEATRPDLSASQREAFFRAVDEYYDRYPTAARGSDFLSVLKDDNLAFARMLDAVVADAHGDATAPAQTERSS